MQPKNILYKYNFIYIYAFKIINNLHEYKPF